MTLRRNFIVRSSAFNTTEAREYFINEGCYGDDLARWLLDRLKRVGVQVKGEPGQEDFGWYAGFEVDGVGYSVVISYRPGEENAPGDWMGTVEGGLGWFGALMKRRPRGVPAQVLERVHSVLESAPEITRVRWFTDEESREEGEGHARPVGE